jgi:hypothetical protein
VQCADSEGCGCAIDTYLVSHGVRLALHMQSLLVWCCIQRI